MARKYHFSPRNTLPLSCHPLRATLLNPILPFGESEWNDRSQRKLKDKCLVVCKQFGYSLLPFSRGATVDIPFNSPITPL